MRYERKTEPLATKKIYYSRIFKNLRLVAVVVATMLLIGTLGYHYSRTEATGWLDSFHNASMILSGMGPVITDKFTAVGKIFSSFYALFSGIVFVGSAGFALMPAVHRLFHKLHLPEK